MISPPAAAPVLNSPVTHSVRQHWGEAWQALESAGIDGEKIYSFLLAKLTPNFGDQSANNGVYPSDVKFSSKTYGIVPVGRVISAK